MKYLLTVLFILLSNASLVLSQQIELSFGTGLSKSSMQDLKELQESRLQALNLPAKITDNFPITLQYSGEARVKFELFHVGLHYSYVSTGNRVSYGDYSGLVNLDVISSSHNIGPFITYPFYSWEKLSFQMYLNINYVSTKVKFKDYFKINNEVSEEQLEVYSSSCAIVPGIEVNYNVSRFNFRLRTGFKIDTKGYLHEKDNTDYYLTDSSGKKIYTNCSGLRVEVMVGINLFKEDSNWQ